MKKHLNYKLFSFLFLPLIGISSVNAASSDLQCKNIDVSVYYTKAYLDNNGDSKYIYFNGKSLLNITPPASSGEKKKLSALSSKFNSFELNSNATSINIGAKNYSTNENYDVLSNSSIEIGTYYAKYIDSNNNEQYIYFNGKSILNITPPVSSGDKKKLAAMTNEFESLPVINNDGTLTFGPLVGQTCSNSSSDLETPPAPSTSDNTIELPPQVPTLQ